MDVRQKIIRNLCGRDVLNIQFVALDEEQEQIEWPKKDGQFYGKLFVHVVLSQITKLFQFGNLIFQGIIETLLKLKYPLRLKEAQK